uniref:Uncharacterized protein n=1 Tax=Anguilla anguilla TaxID=7936 RepID=A0A0E9T112_ANGAN
MQDMQMTGLLTTASAKGHRDKAQPFL